MILDFKKSFYKDLDQLKNPSIANRLLQMIELLKSVNHIREIANLKKMEGYDTFYRIRIGDYRLGIKIKNNSIQLLRFKHRKDIYKYFPPD